YGACDRSFSLGLGAEARMTDLAAAGERFGAARWRVRLFDPLVAAFAAETERRVLWLPVFFGTGIACCFALTVEPPLWFGAATAIALIAVAIALHRRPAPRGVAVALAFAAAGFAVMQEARWEQGGAMLERRMGPVALTGRVIDVDTLDRGWRVVIAPD